MTGRDETQLILFLAILLASARPLGLYFQRVFDGEKTIFHRLFGRLEKAIYHFCGINPKEDQEWTAYAQGILGISAVTCILTYLILRFQSHLPLNPQHLPDLSPHLALNTAISFTTNTNWQFYGGESTMSYFSQMVGLTLHNFVSAAVGISAAVALIRGLKRKEERGLGNFWADLVRCHLYILIPFCFCYAVFLESQGVIQTFGAYVEVTTLEGIKQTIALGPTASQVAIKMLGTNGGGFFNANASHPFENPTALSNFVQMLSIFLIPSALVYKLGAAVNNRKHGWSVWVAMALVFVAGVVVCAHFEYAGSPQFTKLGLATTQNMEGKETRFGVFDSAFFATVTTDASCGAVNSMHDSFTPLGGLVPLVNIMLGEIVFGGVGAGLYGMLIFVILTVFIAGLMVGRTPEYLGKKIEAREVQMVMIAMVVMVFTILVMASIGVLSKDGLAGLANNGPHGFTEILYAYTSAVGNNGSAFAGLSGNTPFWDITMAIAMFCGRFFMMIPMIAVGGSMVKKKIHPGGEGTFPVHGGLFVGLLLGVILLVGALTFFPALTLGPILEHFEMLNGKIF